MRKYLAAIILIGLVIWGFISVQNNNSNSDSNTVSSKANQLKVGLEEGNLAPDFELQRVDGNSIKLSSLQGKKIILNFWASWCPPCRQEMPDMEKLYVDQKDNGVEILAVNLTNIEKSRADVPSFMKAYDITFPVALDEKGKVSQQYDVSSIPASFIIDSWGVIQRKFVGPMTYDSMKSMLKSIK
ncbi:redoxin domain-containing protein [Desulfitobacterium sp.]|uniref:redoxin domain-containing protein n=1 Tax=Desulfitobacterium sp. TaxID=49981 RepID=UPI002C0F25BB|nr:redoxin domain-containing protein [Desulfitobacterium sp.]HVJ49336.1 redoxin domain-containing protein [Desulfitobacterium sp.]